MYDNLIQFRDILRPYQISMITAQKIKFYVKDFFSKCDQIRSFLRLWSHLLKKSLMKNYIFLCRGWSISEE